MNYPIYIISGIGADETAFQLLDFGEITPHFIDWIPPFSNESLASYARRLAIDKIPSSEKPILIGLSFGGMIALEIAKIREVEKIIQISSIQTKQEIPTFQKVIGKLGLSKILPLAPVASPNPFTNYMFGATSKKSKEILYQILRATDKTFLRWAFGAISKWKNETIKENVITIHGTQDKIFPYQSQKYTYTIQGGGHMMVLTHAEEISEILKRIL